MISEISEQRKVFTGAQLGYLINIGCTVCILLDIILNRSASAPSISSVPSVPLLIGILLTLAVLLLSRRPKIAQVTLLIGLAAAFLVAANVLYLQPMLTYLLVVAFSAGYIAVFTNHSLFHQETGRENRARSLLLSLSLSALFNCATAFAFVQHVGPSARFAVVASCMLCCLGFLRQTQWAVAYRKRLNEILYLLLVAASAAVWVGYTVWLEDAAAVSFLIPVAGLVIALKRDCKKLIRNVTESWFNHSEGSIVLCFFFLCVLGSLVLSSAGSMNGDQDFIDIAFTAVSAVCITGLTVINPAYDFTLLGQFFILALVQLGGLGIMSFSALAFYLFGEGLSIKHETALASVYGQRIRGEMRKVLRSVFLLTFAVEGAGALILAAAFRSKGLSFSEALWNGLFTAISSFCNAGFSLHPDNFIAYQKDPLILMTSSILVIIGGLSPAFLFGIRQLRKTGAQNLQNKIVFMSTALLLVAGTAMFLVFEWDRVMAGLSVDEKLVNAFFVSAISRTAGFNNFDPAAFYPATQFSLLFFMFIGGSPGGTAGGIKTTCMAVIAAAVYHTVKGRPDVVILRRRIDPATVRRAFSVFTLSLLCVCSAILSLLATQKISVIESMFEVVSAFGTVGLTMAVTPRLDPIGKMIIMLCMFIGRVGPLAVLLYLTEHQKGMTAKVPTEEITVV